MMFEETGTTFQENARIKVDAYQSAYSGNIFAEDTGLEVEALNGAPGVNHRQICWGQCQCF